MVSAVLVLGSSTSLVSNASLVLTCVIAAVAVSAAAPRIASLTGWRRVGANAAMTALAWLAVLSVGRPQLVAATAAAMLECGCMWWWELCCYIEGVMRSDLPTRESILAAKVAQWIERHEVLALLGGEFEFTDDGRLVKKERACSSGDVRQSRERR